MWGRGLRQFDDHAWSRYPICRNRMHEFNRFLFIFMPVALMHFFTCQQVRFFVPAP
jgi:hypothetical protein